jgi:hypothetical protein
VDTKILNNLLGSPGIRKCGHITITGLRCPLHIRTFYKKKEEEVKFVYELTKEIKIIQSLYRSTKLQRGPTF